MHMADPTIESMRPDFVPTDTPAERHNRRLGLWLFLLYAIAYALFVGLTVYDYRIMGREAFAGLNLAIVYGMALIVGAFALALVYMVACKREVATDGAPMNTDFEE